MLLTLRSIPLGEDALNLRPAAVHENSLDSRPSPSRGQALRGNDAQAEALRLLRLRVIGDECRVASETDTACRAARRNPPQNGRAPSRDRFEIEDLIENLRLGAANPKARWYERSQEVVEIKGKCFSHSLQSQEVSEKKGVISVKPRDY